jgi:MoaA/NifB/PqqE/SkfB family radical SAM enzyme
MVAHTAAEPRSAREHICMTLKPKHIRVEASSFCQLRCPSCPTTTGAIDPAVGKGFLRFEDFRHLIDDNPFVKRIELSNYGEIFLNPHLLSMLEYAHARRVLITIANGANLNHARDEVLEGLARFRVRLITCSIDGASPETYRRYRVRGDFARVIRNIQEINRHKRLHRSSVPVLLWQFVVFGHNEHEIPLARAMAEKLGMQFRTKLTWDEKFSPIRDGELVRAATGEQAITRDEYEAIHGRKYVSETCLQLWDDPQINWDGKLLGCCRNFWGDFGANAFADGLVAALNGEKIAYARDMLAGRARPRDDIPCTTCEMYRGMRARGRFIDRPAPSES